MLWLGILSASVGLTQLSSGKILRQIPHGLVNELHSVFKVCSYHSCRHDYRVSVLSTLLTIHAYMYYMYVIASILSSDTLVLGLIGMQG